MKISRRQAGFWGALVGLFILGALTGCGPKTDNKNTPLGTIYYTGPKVPKSSSPLGALSRQ